MCNDGAPIDVWYKFVANTSAYNINVAPTATGGIYEPRWQLLSGDCNNLTPINCISNSATFENLVPGNTYYLRVASSRFYEQYQGTFTICIKSINTAVPNDICINAIDVPISNEVGCVTNVTGTTTGAGISLTTGFKDVWYKFTATETAHKIKVSPVADSLKNVAFEVYSGNCSALTSIAYVNNFSDPGFSYNNFDTTKPETQSVGNLVIGDTYYIRVYGDAVYRNHTIVYPDGSFNICVSLSANDVCTIAKTIAVNPEGSCNSITIDSTDYSTPSIDIPYGSNCGLVNPVNDSWFRFTALDTAQIIQVFELSGYLSGWQLFSGSCGLLSSMACISGNINRQVIGGLTIGQTYYLRVYSGLSVTRCKFSICVSAVAVNNECSSAFAIPVNTSPGCSVVTNGTTSGSTASSPGTCGPNTNPLFYVSFVGLGSAYCVSDAIVTLTGSPVGGTFSGPGVSGNNFNPASAGVVGPYTIIYNYTNANGCSNSSAQQVTVNSCPTFSTLFLKVFLEGFHLGANAMAATKYDLDMSTDPTATDEITVNLWSPASLSNALPDYSVSSLLHTNGISIMQFPASVLNNPYYIAVKHRSSIETWSKLPVIFTSSTSYDFTTSLAKAYDDGIMPPMKNVGGSVFAIYAGDINQDGGIDGSDMNVIDNEIGFFGYNVSDVNGDMGTDGSDMNYVDNNSQLGLFFARPY